jgi:hypothetical protein
MRRSVLKILVLATVVAAAAAGAKNWARDLGSNDEDKRTRAAQELMGKAREEGLTGDEIEALAEAVDDPSEEIQRYAITALASNTKIATSEQYAPYFANRGNNFVAFLLWYSIHHTYEGFVELTGGPGPGDAEDEMEYAQKEARRAFDNLLDPERKGWAEPFVEEISE